MQCDWPAHFTTQASNVLNHIWSSHVDDCVLHIHVYIVPTMLTEQLYPLQYGDTPLVLAASGRHTTCVERLLSTPGIDVDTTFQTIMTNYWY